MTSFSIKNREKNMVFVKSGKKEGKDLVLPWKSITFAPT